MVEETNFQLLYVNSKYDFLFGSIRPYFYKAGICPYDGVSNTSVFILRAKKLMTENLYIAIPLVR